MRYVVRYVCWRYAYWACPSKVLQVKVLHHNLEKSSWKFQFLSSSPLIKVFRWRAKIQRKFICIKITVSRQMFKCGYSIYQRLEPRRITNKSIPWHCLKIDEHHVKRLKDLVYYTYRYEVDLRQTNNDNIFFQHMKYAMKIIENNLKNHDFNAWLNKHLLYSNWTVIIT